MAMINCPECGKEVSSEAKTCPHCGIQVSKKLKQAEKQKNREAAAKPSGEKPGNKKIPLLVAVAAVVVAVVLLVVLVVLPQAERNKRMEPYKTVGNVVTFGHYEQDADESNGPEPIEWIVLDVQGEKALLLSKYGLDSKKYNTEYVGVTWETCTLRNWLNSDFLVTAFTDEEKSAILLSEVDNSKSQGFSWYDADGGNNTQDKIFLLSWAEAEKYLETSPYDSNNQDKVYPEAQVVPTAYAVRKGAWKSSVCKTAEGDATGYWWLRSPGDGDKQNYAAFVLDDGSLRSEYVSFLYAVVRPAFWLNLESELF